MEELNDDFRKTDVVIVINSKRSFIAQHDPTSPIAGMPVLEIWKAKTSAVMKHSVALG